MFPKLYNSNETNFNHNGLGLLTGSMSAVATEELNGMFELHIEYDSEGFLADVIDEEMIIKAKANDKQDEQLFRIYSITKNHENDNLIIDAQHITYDLSNNFVESLEARNLTKRQVMQLIGSSTQYSHPFNVTSSNNTTQSSTSLYRTNPLQMIGGMEGSVLQIWGGQIERDNFNLIMHDRRGSDDGVLVTYKKNLTGLNAKFDISNLVTRIFPYVFIPANDDEPEQLITVPGKYIDSPHINNYEMPYILPVDFSHEEGIETSQDLLNAASNWFVETGRDNPRVEMEVQFEHLWETEEYKDVAALELVGMGDAITVKHSKLKVEGTAIVNRIEYDVIARKNIAVDVGNVKASFTDKVNQVGNIVDRVEQAEQSANQAIRAANGKNTIYYGPDEPVGNLVEGDLWFRVVDGEYTRTYRFDGIQWQLIVSKDVKDIEETANSAHNQANEAVEKANLATSNANEAIQEAQTAFDDAQAALTTANDASTLASTVHNLATALDTTVSGHSTTITDIENELSRKMTTIDADNKYATQSALQQTSQSLSSDIVAVQGNLDGLEIGGRNLLVGSDYFTDWDILNSSLNPISGTQEIRNFNSIVFNTPSNGVSILSELTAVEYGGTYTAQACVERLAGQGNSFILGVLAYDLNGNLLNEEVLEVINGTEGLSNRSYVESYRGLLSYGDNGPNSLWVTFNVNDNRVSYVRVRAGNYRTGSDFVQRVKVSNMQLETGNKVTGWDRAPEDNEYQFSSFKQTVSDVTVRVGNSEGDITALQATATGFASRIENAEGDINTLTSTAQGLQNRISNAEGDISTVTSLANATQTRMTNAEGDINTLTQTASSLDSTIRNLEYENRNLLLNSDFTGLPNPEHWRPAYGSNFTTHNTTNIRVNRGDSRYLGVNTKISVEKGVTYTLSVNGARGTNMRELNYIHIWHNQDINNAGLANQKLDNITLDGAYSTKSITFTANHTSNNVDLGLSVQGDPDTSLNTYFVLAWVKLEKGAKATPWSPASEDIQSQFTQLSNNINARVEKGDVINQINISTEDILISGKKLILDGDTTVTGTFRVANANITSINASKLTTGTLDAANVNIININASNITAGTIQGIDIIGSTITTQSGSNSITLKNGQIETHVSGVKRFGLYGVGMKAFSWVTGEEVASFRSTNLSGTYGAGIMGSGSYFNIGEIDPTTGSDSSYLFFDFDKENISVRRGLEVREKTELWDDLNMLYGGTLSTSSFATADSSRRVLDFYNSSIVFNNSNYEGIALRRLDSYAGLFFHSNRTMLTGGTLNDFAVLAVGSDGTGSFVQSLDVYSRTYTSTTQMVRVTDNGVLGRSTSSRRYKLLEEEISLDYAKRILNVKAKSWYDKRASEELAHTLSTGEETEDQQVKRIIGNIAEDMHDEGLELLVNYDDENRPDGIANNAWVLHTPLITDLYASVDALKLQNEQLILKVAHLEDRLNKLEVAS